jgi:hypothetical protein
MSPQHPAAHTEFSKGKFFIPHNFNKNRQARGGGGGGICPPHEGGSAGAVQCVQCVAHMQEHKHFALRFCLDRQKLVRY